MGKWAHSMCSQKKSLTYCKVFTQEQILKSNEYDTWSICKNPNSILEMNNVKWERCKYIMHIMHIMTVCILERTQHTIMVTPVHSHTFIRGWDERKEPDCSGQVCTEGTAQRSEVEDLAEASLDPRLEVSCSGFGEVKVQWVGLRQADQEAKDRPPCENLKHIPTNFSYLSKKQSSYINKRTRTDLQLHKGRIEFPI